MTTNKIKFITGPMRVPFLLLPPVCVLLGIGTAYGEIGHIHWAWACLALLGALAAHISVNALNEYVDCRSGLDARTERTPFSGGSGTLPQRPAMAYVALTTGLTALAICVAIGIYFAALCGAGILPLALIGVLVILAYTPWLTHRPLLCLIAPGLGFGLMTLGTHFVLTGSYSWTAATASLVPFFLVSDLLLLNQFPDREADKTVGRRHLLIVLGARRSSLVYGAFLIATYLAVVVGVLAGVLPTLCLLGLLTMPLAVLAMRGAYRFGEDIPKLLPYMGLNVVLNLATPVLVAIAFFIKSH
ncbi:MAG: prenyltransferase [Bacillota bacterium]